MGPSRTVIPRKIADAVERSAASRAHAATTVAVLVAELLPLPERERIDALIGALAELARERTAVEARSPSLSDADATKELIRLLSKKWRGDARRLLWQLRERQSAPQETLLAELGISASSLDSLVRGIGKDAARVGIASTLILRRKDGSVHAGPSLLAMTPPWTATGEVTMR